MNNKKFENIFEKYNIQCSDPRKRKKNIKTTNKSFSFQQSRQNLFSKTNSILEKTTCSSVSNSIQCIYFNNSARNKYYSPTRYKTLDFVKVESLNRSIREIGSKSTSNNNSAEDYYIKENVPLEALPDLNSNENQSSMRTLSCSFNFRKPKPNCKNRTQSFYKQLNITPIPKSNRNLNNSFESQSINESYNNYSPEASQVIEPPLSTQEAHVSTELDLLIDLIEREDKNIKNKETHKREDDKNSNKIPPISKSCLKGGCEEMFGRALKRETIKGNFLKHDRKIGLRIGKLLTVVKLQTAYDLTVAVVKREELNTNIAIVITKEMESQLKVGTKIEAFFDDKSRPYKFPYNDEVLDVYLEPYKLLIV